MSNYEYAESMEQARVLAIRDEVVAELNKARSNFPPFHTAHEGYAIILEELDEMWDEVRKQYGDHDRLKNIRKEAIQVAAMAMRMVLDICDVS